MNWDQRITQTLQQRQQADAYRQRRVLHSSSDGRAIHHAGQRYLNFSSNDYLGLSHHPHIIQAWQQGAQRYGIGSGGSSHVTGYTIAHQQLEEALADWLGYPRALLCLSGYAANQMLITALMQSDDHILADRLCHASLLEAAMHSPAQLRRFRHNHPAALQLLLHKRREDPSSKGQTLIVTEGIFSMDGDSAPLVSLQQLSREAGAWLMVDDAHGVGVTGQEGRGSCDQQGVKPDILVVTFGKAFGVSGAAILCQTPVAEYLLQFARHLIYSTSMPPAQACALLAALEVVRQGDELRCRLQRNITYFRQRLLTSGIPLTDSISAIQPIILGDNRQTLACADRLRAQGIWITAIRPPTVPEGSARLRITLTAQHSLEDVDQLTEALYVVTNSDA